MNRVTQDGNVFPILHLLERAIQHGKLPTKEQRDPNSSHFIKVFRPIDFIKWAKKKGIELPDGLEELVKQYSASDFEDLETKCQRLEAEKNDQNILIQNLKEENNRLKEELKPLYGGERNGWIKTIANFIGSNYDKLLNKKDTKDWVEEVYKDFENVESSTDIELYDITPEKSTLTKQLKMVQKYCKEHSKPSTKK